MTYDLTEDTLRIDIVVISSRNWYEIPVRLMFEISG